MHLEADRDIDAKHQWNHWPPLFNPSTIGVRSEEVKQQVIKRRSVIAGVGGLLGTPAIVRALNTEINNILKMQDIVTLHNSAGIIPLGSTPEAFAKYIASETEKWAKVIKEANIKLE